MVFYKVRCLKLDYKLRLSHSIYDFFRMFYKMITIAVLCRLCDYFIKGDDINLVPTFMFVVLR